MSTGCTPAGLGGNGGRDSAAPSWCGRCSPPEPQRRCTAGGRRQARSAAVLGRNSLLAIRRGNAYGAAAVLCRRSPAPADARRTRRSWGENRSARSTSGRATARSGRFEADVRDHVKDPRASCVEGGPLMDECERSCRTRSGRLATSAGLPPACSATRGVEPWGRFGPPAPAVFDWGITRSSTGIRNDPKRHQRQERPLSTSRSPPPRPHTAPLRPTPPPPPGGPTASPIATTEIDDQLSTVLAARPRDRDDRERRSPWAVSG